ncbi:MAG: flap endonuclease [Gammaproteobacteria bacterium]|nr:flap endonuclease [Gammaproteobacteria bacterium]
MRLYLVDSSIFIFKAWFAQRQATSTASGEPNQAFIGFSDFVYQLLTEIAPAKLVFAFDESLRHSQRNAIYADYKANRSPAPQELKRQFIWCRQWIEHLGISAVSSDSWEADDLIGTLATLHRCKDLQITILSADKDLTQLIRDGDIWWPFFQSVKLDYRAIHKKFGVRPEQIANLLALTGDKVDNIPGIPFIGMKTAANLLRKYDNLTRLRQNLDQVGKMKFRYAGRVQESLIENQHILDISSRLTRINCKLEGLDQIPIDRSTPAYSKLYEMIESQAMDPIRRQKWQDFIDSA